MLMLIFCYLEKQFNWQLSHYFHECSSNEDTNVIWDPFKY